MEKEFVKYEQALSLKELGFDEPCFTVYTGTNILIRLTGKPVGWCFIDEVELIKNNSSVGSLGVTAPLYQQAVRWFREKHGLMHIINPYHFTAEIDYLNERVVDEKYGDFIPHDHLVDDEGEEIKHSSYEEAESACLDKLIEICKNK